ncbi:MAG: hypothetical protein E7561_05190, partial [Ruminococcaceae bacterium]|nr:hypothetical protein [Oscillospiraceae bacterium]
MRNPFDMSERIKVYENNEKLTLGSASGSTTHAFNVAKCKELMRDYTLSFSIANNDSVFNLIKENSIFKYNGQLFDIAGIDGDSGTQNITQVVAEHISYRLSEYTIPDGYSFAGTIKQIAEDILAEAKLLDGTPANTVFSIGETVDIGIVSFGMHGSTNVTAREALIAMSKLGLEVDFDNFIINLPERLGTDDGIKFEYGVNLNGVHRTWQKNNGWSYDIKIVDLQKKAGYENYQFNLGDTITVYDSLANTTMSKRIISYTECGDPRENRVTVGVFVRDNASLAIETDRIANNAQNVANNSVQQGKKYSNVSINHTDGFVAINRAGNQRVVMNADDCFAVQILKNGEWVTVNNLEEFGLIVDRLSSKDAKDNFYINIGKVDEDNYGLLFIIKGEKGLSIESPDNEEVTISSPRILELRTSKAFLLTA